MRRDVARDRENSAGRIGQRKGVPLVFSWPRMGPASGPLSPCRLPPPAPVVLPWSSPWSSSQDHTPRGGSISGGVVLDPRGPRGPAVVPPWSPRGPARGPRIFGYFWGGVVPVVPVLHTRDHGPHPQTPGPHTPRQRRNLSSCSRSAHPDHVATHATGVNRTRGTPGGQRRPVIRGGVHDVDGSPHPNPASTTQPPPPHRRELTRTRASLPTRSHARERPHVRARDPPGGPPRAELTYVLANRHRFFMSHRPSARGC